MENLQNEKCWYLKIYGYRDVYFDQFMLGCIYLFVLTVNCLSISTKLTTEKRLRGWKELKI